MSSKNSRTQYQVTSVTTIARIAFCGVILEEVVEQELSYV